MPTINLSELPRGGTFCLSKAGLGIAGTSTKLKITAPNGAGVDYCIDGVLYHCGDADNLVMTAGTAQSDLTTCIYLVCLDSVATLSTVQGTEVLTANLTAGTHTLEFPEAIEGTCPIGYVKVVTSGATYTAGTTGLDNAAVTDTYVDLFAVPPQPLTS